MPRLFDAVLFDIGGVFWASPYDALETLGDEVGADYATVHDIVLGPYERDTDHPWHRLERGELNLDDARTQIMALATAEGLDLDPFRMLELIGSAGRDPFAAVIARTRQLRQDGYRTAAVTNNIREFADAWRAPIDADLLFDEIVDSSHEGIRKPDVRMFRLALERLGGVDAERTVFLDDTPSNIASAAGIGISGILVTDIGSALEELDALLAG